MLNLPEEFETFDELKKKGFIEIKKEKDKGKNVVGIFCSYTPVELIMAIDAHFVSLCGGDDASIAAAEKFLPKTLCPLIKSSYGLAITDSCPYFYFSDAILAETTCDGKKKMYELLGEIKPTHVMHLPQSQTAALAIEAWTEEMKQTATFLEQQFGRAITPESLRHAIIERNRVRKALLQLYEVAALVPSPVSGYELSSVVESTDFHFTDDDIVEGLNQKIEEYLARYVPQNPDAKKRPRLMVTGCPIGGCREKILKAVEDLGADVVAFDSCSGPRTQKVLVDETIDPYRALAEKYLLINCSVMSPNHGRFEDMKEMLEHYQVDGVIELILHGCHTFAVEAYYTKKFITETMELPYICIDADFSTSDAGQIRTRLEAFLEMLQ